MANIDELRTLAQKIKNETNVGANTANRVGTTFEKTVTELETIEGNVENIEGKVTNLSGVVSRSGVPISSASLEDSIANNNEADKKHHSIRFGGVTDDAITVVGYGITGVITGNYMDVLWSTANHRFVAYSSISDKYYSEWTGPRVPSSSDYTSVAPSRPEELSTPYYDKVYIDNAGRVYAYSRSKRSLVTAASSLEDVMKQLFLAADSRPSTNPLKLKFNDTTDYYEMNGLTDLTFDDMLRVYTTANLTNHPFGSGFGYALMRTQARTNYPAEVSGWSDTVDVSVRAMCADSWIEVCVLTGNETGAHNNVIVVNEATWFLNKSRRLKAFLNPIRIKTSSVLRYAGQGGNEVLERIYLQIVPDSGQTNFVTGELFRSANIKYECFRYLVDNSTTSSTATATVSVNATTYQFMTGETEPTEAVGGTSEQWQQLVTDGAEKGITFVAL